MVKEVQRRLHIKSVNQSPFSVSTIDTATPSPLGQDAACCSFEGPVNSTTVSAYYHLKKTSTASTRLTQQPAALLRSSLIIATLSSLVFHTMQSRMQLLGSPLQPRPHNTPPLYSNNHKILVFSVKALHDLAPVRLSPLPTFGNCPISLPVCLSSNGVKSL